MNDSIIVIITQSKRHADRELVTLCRLASGRQVVSRALPGMAGRLDATNQEQHEQTLAHVPARPSKPGT